MNHNVTVLTNHDEFPSHIDFQCGCCGVSKAIVIEHMWLVTPRCKDRRKHGWEDHYDSIFIRVCESCAQAYPKDATMLKGWDIDDAIDGIDIYICPNEWSK